MWIAIVFVIFVNGEAAQDYAAVPSEEECVKLQQKLDDSLAANKQVAGWTNSCVNVKELKKPGQKV